MFFQAFKESMKEVVKKVSCKDAGIFFMEVGALFTTFGVGMACYGYGSSNSSLGNAAQLSNDVNSQECTDSCSSDCRTNLIFDYAEWGVDGDSYRDEFAVDGLVIAIIGSLCWGFGFMLTMCGCCGADKLIFRDRDNNNGNNNNGNGNDGDEQQPLMP